MPEGNDPAHPDRDANLRLADRWRAELESRGRGVGYARERHRHVAWVLAQTGDDLAGAAVAAAIAKLAADGRSARLCGIYLASVKAFARWRFLTTDPLFALAPPDDDAAPVQTATPATARPSRGSWRTWRPRDSGAREGRHADRVQ